MLYRDAQTITDLALDWLAQDDGRPFFLAVNYMDAHRMYNTSALAANPGTLATLRRSLRQRVAASSLCDGNGFAHRMENAYRTIWQRWCEGLDPPAGARQ